MDDEDSDVCMNQSSEFNCRTTIFVRKLEEIEVVTLELQNSGATFSNCRDAIDSQIESLETYRNRYNSLLCRCCLGQEYKKNRFNLFPSSVFEAGTENLARASSYSN